jgi:ADP-heptose:LPS heptosyltransferase
MEQKTNKKKEVVIVRFSALGDVAMCVAVLYSVCRSHPEIQFTFVTKQTIIGILVNRPANLTVIGVDLKDTYKGIGGMYRLSKELGKPAMFIDLHSVLRTHILCALMRLKGVRVLKIDKGRKYRRYMVKNGANTISPLKNMFTRYAEVFAKVPFTLDNRFEGLYAESPAEVSLFSSVTAPKGNGECWIGVAPFAAHESKIYPLEKMQQVVNKLAENANTKIFLFGGGAVETQTLTEWAYNHDNVICVAGKKLGFKGELALMNYLDLMVCMDSGNMHLAAIAGAKTLSIWGATHPAAGYTAWKSTAEERLDLILECRPCSIFGDKKCKYGTHACMTAIKPRDIVERVNFLLKKNANE